MRWIRIEEEWPEFEEPVLVTCLLGFRVVQLILFNNKKYWFEVGNGFSMDQETLNVKEWMVILMPKKIPQSLSLSDVNPEALNAKSYLPSRFQSRTCKVFS